MQPYVGSSRYQQDCALSKLWNLAQLKLIMEPMPETPRVLYDGLKISKLSIIMKLYEINYGHWLEQDEAIRLCSNNTTLKGKQHFDIYLFISMTHGPEYRPSPVVVVVARQLGATLTLPNVRGDKLGEKRSFREIYNADKFLASLSGVVQVEKNPPAEGRIPTIRVPNRVSEEFVSLEIKPIFQSKRNIKIVAYFNSSANKMKGQVNQQTNAYQCLAMFESLKLQPGLQELADSMLGTLRSLSTKMHGRFVAIDLRVLWVITKATPEI